MGQPGPGAGAASRAGAARAQPSPFFGARLVFRRYTGRPGTLLWATWAAVSTRRFEPVGTEPDRWRASSSRRRMIWTPPPACWRPGLQARSFSSQGALTGCSRSPGQHQAALAAQRPELPQVVRVDAAILVAHDQDFAVGRIEARLHDFGQAQAERVPHRANLRIEQRHLPRHVGRVVGRAVVDDQQFEAVGELGQQFEQRRDVVFQAELSIEDRQQYAHGRFQAGSSHATERRQSGRARGSITGRKIVSPRWAGAGPGQAGSVLPGTY